MTCRRRGTGQGRAGVAHLRDTVGEIVLAELKAVGAKGVRLDEFGATGDVVQMNLADDFRAAEIQLVKTLVKCHTPGVEECAHGAVRQQDALLEAGQEWMRLHHTVSPVCPVLISILPF